MRSFLDAVAAHARSTPDRTLFTDAHGALSYAGLLGDAARLAGRLPREARVIGLYLPNGREWAVAQVACIVAGRIAVPLPRFFSPQQIRHILRDAGVELILTAGADEAAAETGLACLPVTLTGEAGALPAFRDGFGEIIYTSGSTGAPKGVRHESGQMGWQAAALAGAIGATAEDSYLSVLPLSLLLETLCAIFVPAFAGGRAHFETGLAEAVGRGSARGIAAAFAARRPSVGVVVPELLRAWVGELVATGATAPESLRFVAAGGAPVPPGLAEAAWRLGIPVHEGYGLSECCSVVALNRPGARVAGTVGDPLPGLSLRIRDGEILVDGPSVTDGYLGGAPAARPWATGDLGALDAAGRLTVYGRKDNLIVTPFGRNVSPEWVEAALLDAPGVGWCAVDGDQQGLAALVIPLPGAEDRFADDGASEALLAQRCRDLPAYARPSRVTVVPLARAKALGLLTDNGRVRRPAVRALLQANAPLPPLSPAVLEERREP